LEPLRKIQLVVKKPSAWPQHVFDGSHTNPKRERGAHPFALAFRITCRKGCFLDPCREPVSRCRIEARRRTARCPAPALPPLGERASSGGQAIDSGSESTHIGTRFHD